MAIPLNDLEQYRGSMRRILTRLLPVTLALAVAAGGTGVAAAQQNPGPYTGQTGNNLTEQQQAQGAQNQQQQVQNVAGRTASSGTCVYVSLSLFNPQPGNPLPPGNIIITGQAQDIRSTQGNGISNVQLFLRPRITGGTFLGYATFGLPTTNNPNGVAPTGGMPTSQFSINASMPSTQLGPQSLEAIATSAVDGYQYIVIVPFMLNNPALPLNTTSGSMATTELPPLCAPGQQPAQRPFSGVLGGI